MFPTPISKTKNQRVRARLKPMILLALCALKLLACSNQAESPKSQMNDKDQYIAYLQNQENGLSGAKVGQYFLYQVQYLPATAQALTLENGELANGESFEQNIKDLSKHQYWMLTILPKFGKNTIEETLKISLGDTKAAELNESFPNRLTEHFKLIAGKDTIACESYFAQLPIFDYSPLRFNVVFPSTGDKYESLTLRCDIPGFPEQIPAFSINQRDIFNIPTLKL
jgi:hypothetical protein